MVHIGKILQSFRKEKNLNINQIAKGLCSVNFLSKCEREEQIPDALLFEYLMERIGVSPEDFSIMATEEEYIFFAWREHVYDAIERKNWEELADLRKNCHVFEEDCNKNILHQMEYFIKGILAAVQNSDWKKASEYMKKAVIQTNPKFFQTLDTTVRLGTKELHMMLLYLYYGVLGQAIEKKTGKEMFYQLEKYILHNKMENYELAKIYPKLICISLHLFEEEIEVKDKICLCENAVNLLRATYKFYDIVELLGLYLSLLKQENSNQSSFYEKQYQTFLELHQRNHTNYDFAPEYIVYQKPKVYLITEYLYSKRMEKQLTQFELSEGVYEHPESYSRVERGVTKPFPRKLQLLVDKLDINWCRYRGELETDNLEVFRLRLKHRTFFVENKWEEGFKILEQMENLMDMHQIVNQQYIESHKIVAMYFLGKTDAQTVSSKLRELLNLTKTIDNSTESLVYYSQTEIEIITYIAKMLCCQQKYEEGIFLIKTMLEQMNRSRVGLEYHKNGITFALRVLSDLYFSCKEYEMSIEVLNDVYNMYMKNKNGVAIPNVLDGIADNLEHISEVYNQEYKDLYRKTYYVADFYNIQYIKDSIEKHYKENFDRKIQWY